MLTTRISFIVVFILKLDGLESTQIYLHFKQMKELLFILLPVTL